MKACESEGYMKFNTLFGVGVKTKKLEGGNNLII